MSLGRDSIPAPMCRSGAHNLRWDKRHSYTVLEMQIIHGQHGEEVNRYLPHSCCIYYPRLWVPVEQVFYNQHPYHSYNNIKHLRAPLVLLNLARVDGYIR